MGFSHNAKNVIGLCWERCKHIPDSCDLWHKWLSLEQEQIKALELGLTGYDVLVTLPTGYGKS